MVAISVNAGRSIDRGSLLDCRAPAIFGRGAGWGGGATEAPLSARALQAPGSGGRWLAFGSGWVAALAWSFSRLPVVVLPRLRGTIGVE